MLSLLLFIACGEKDVTQKDPVDGEVLVDLDGDGYLNNEDCDDDDSNTFPNAVEVCDGFDNNCDGQADEGVLELFYADSDGDGFGSENLTTEACEVPEGYVSNGTDCNDLEPNTYPSAEEVCDGIDNDCNNEIDEDLEYEFYLDSDGDGFGNENEIVEGCDLSIGLSSVSGDCDDTDPTVSPSREEVCDGIDNDCNGEVDDGVLLTFYADVDEDGYGDPNQSQQACEPTEGMVDNGDDCNDLETLAHPNFFEICDGVDNNCDNQIDEDTALDTVAFYADFDNDGHGNPNNVTYACDLPENHVTTSDDCDDANNLRSPSEVEDCDGLDNDCDELVDESAVTLGTVYYLDNDNDDYGNPNMSMMACSLPDGYVENSGDCDDDDNDNYEGADEVCDGVDNDCDEDIDEDAIDQSLFYQDSDSDTFGDANTTMLSCSLPEGFVGNSEDCDDDNDAISPNGEEDCDGVDNDCDELIDESAVTLGTVYYLDNDNDDYGNPNMSMMACSLPDGYVENSGDCDDEDNDNHEGADEVCDGVDNDCDEDIDEDAIDRITQYADEDGDGFGNVDLMVAECSLMEGYVVNNEDCDDDQPLISPIHTEICDGIDNNCVDGVDETSLVYGEASLCSALDCKDIKEARPSSTDGYYWIDPEDQGDGGFEVYCDMTTNGGGWTLVGSFMNDDNAYNWTHYGPETNNIDNWFNEQTFGDLNNFTGTDYKSPAFWRVEATDLLAQDDAGGWASYEGALTDSLRGTLQSYSSCQTGFLNDVVISSSSPAVEALGKISFFGGDPNNSGLCALNYSPDGTDAAVISLAHQRCGTTGFGHLGYLTGGGVHTDNDTNFCLQDPSGTYLVANDLGDPSSCQAGYNGQTALYWFDSSACSYSLLYVR